ncbi:metal-dependent hydrolase [Candidatus Woesearchaeota archaeon]|nr:metal-dependent hydrolase [Candidatus Woesearchaeota archaeon]
MAVALFAGLLKVKIIPLPINKYVFLSIVVVSALLPDIDYDSFIARKLKLRFVRFFFAHRGFFHSILPMVFFMILAFLITGNPYYSLAVLIGFGSHLAFDSITMKGIAWFWPSKLRAKGPLKTGGIVDWILLLVFILMDAVMVVVVF